MRIKLLEDHIGRETDMQLYGLNEVKEIEAAKGLELIRLGFAQQVIRVIIPDPEPIEEPLEEPMLLKVKKKKAVTNG